MRYKCVFYFENVEFLFYTRHLIFFIFYIFNVQPKCLIPQKHLHDVCHVPLCNYRSTAAAKLDMKGNN